MGRISGWELRGGKTVASEMGLEKVDAFCSLSVLRHDIQW